jgi:ABC-type cobalamin/Fe3+-siderophores transport system ATPase subunit
LAQDGDIVLLDEPASHLDGGAAAFLAKELCTLRDMGKAVFCVMHDVTGAVEIADRIAVLQKGELVFTGDREEFLSQKIPERFLHLTRYRAEDENGTPRLFFR